VNYRRLWPLLSLALVACEPYERAVKKIDEDHQKATDVLSHVKEGNAYLNKIQQPTVPVQEIAPAWLNEPVSLVVEDAHFKYVIEELIDGKSLNMFLKEGVDPSKKVSLKFSGTLREALDYVADIVDYGYQIDGNMITWSPFIVQTFDVNFLPAETHFSMGGGSVGAATPVSGALAGATGTTGIPGYPTTTSSINGTAASSGTGAGIAQAGTSTINGQGNLWKEIEEGVKELLSPEGKMKLSRALTMLTVRDHPSNMKMVRQYLEHLNKTLGSQVLIKVMILDVTLNDDFKFGIDWNLIANNLASTNNQINFNLPFNPTPTFGAGNATTGIQAFLKNGTLKGTQLLLSALENQGNVSIITEPVTVTMNNQVAELNIVTDQVYIASTTSNLITGNAGAAGASVTVNPGVISTGLSLYLLPKIFEEGVYLQINAILSTLLSTNTVNVSGGGSVQGGSTIGTPVTSSKKFNQRSVVKNGDTLIISGFKESTTNANNTSLFGMDFLGQKSSTGKQREIVMLITPHIITPAPSAKGGNILASGNIERASFLSKEENYVKASLDGAEKGIKNFVTSIPRKIENIAADVKTHINGAMQDGKTIASNVAEDVRKTVSETEQSIQKWI